MSGETKSNVSPWTIDSLKEHFEQRFVDSEKAVNAALVAAKQAVEKAEVNAEKWRENANEWRGSMLDRETKFASKAEVEAEIKGIRSELQSLKESRAAGQGSTTGKTDQRVIIQWIIMIILALIAIAPYIRR